MTAAPIAHSRPIVAIDGHAGAGKSTVARLIAQKLGMPYVDTGAMYRAATVAVLREAVKRGDNVIDRLTDSKIAEIVAHSDIRISPDGGAVVDGVDASEDIRGEAATRYVSRVSAIQAVREGLVPLQRSLVSGGGVLEGRDIGTAVFPDADVKIFLTASLAERARRRARQTGEPNLDAVKGRLAERDRQDTSRAVSPLEVASDAWVIDTTELSVDEAVNAILAICGDKGIGAVAE